MIVVSSRCRLALTACVLLLGGCNASRIDYQWASLGYNLGDVSYGADHRDLRVDVVGGPPTMPPAEFAAAVAAAMPRAIGIAAHFTATPDASAHPMYRVLWNFAPPGDRHGRESCAAPTGGPVAAPSVARSDGVFVAFCRGASAMSGAYGRFERTLDPNDPAFRAFVHDMTLAVFPRGGTGRKGY